jgi:eukaryotic-like serine/threonine-protein kinase
MPLSCPRCRRVLQFSGAPPPFCSFCGHALSETTPEATVQVPDSPTPGAEPRGCSPPATLGNYRLLRPLGAGGMGVVYEAEALDTGRPVALKLIAPEYAGSPEAMERFRREGRLASALAHPRCVFVLAAEEEEGRPFIVMELMPGSTLKDLVARQGPLAVEDAITKTLDLLDGLVAVHRRGIIHRDLKPSNCFLDADGRVKVGDFGLARTLVAESDLTRTGKFLGTPLFASPEQLKGEPVDVRTDVYSVAATLYFLLTGKAPFEGANAAAVAARVASEPAQPMRLLRPDLPRGLDRTVLRGLDRDRRRRWRDPDKFRAALLRFLPARPSIGGVGLRAAAFLIDYPVVFGLWLLVKQLLKWGWPGLSVTVTEHFVNDRFIPDLAVVPYFIFFSIPPLVYFTTLEGVWGCGLGKWLLRLRVTARGSSRPPGLARALLRTAIFWVLLKLPELTVQLLPLDCLTHLVLSWLASTPVGGAFLVLTTMRERNGYRGPHELLSGTKVIRLCWPGRNRPGSRRLGRACREVLEGKLGRPPQLPAEVGPFRLDGALGWNQRGGFLLGEDPVLGRKVLLWLRPAAEPPLTGPRCDVNRLTRPRWLTGGVDGAWRWDAFFPEGGCLLTEVVAVSGPLPWREARPLLQQLAEELNASCSDTTLPAILTPGQVWLGAGGRIQLLDVDPREPPADGGEPAAGSDPARALSLLARAAVLLLEGRTDPAPQPVRVPLPLHAARMVNRLVGVEPAYATVEEFQADLTATQDRPTELPRWHRAVHILVQAGLVVSGYLLLCALLPPLRPGIGSDAGGLPPGSLFWVVLGTFILWSALARGGPSFGLCGIALVRTDGRRPARWQAGLRALLAWAQGLGFLWLSILAWKWWIANVRDEAGNTLNLDDAPFLLGLLVLYALLAVWLPRRPLHDRLAGTCIVPR